MKSIRTFLSILVVLLLPSLTASAQLAVTVSPPKIVGQKAVVKIAMKNGLAQNINSARAVCFLFDVQGRMVGQAARWVIGQNKTGLDANATNTFNFVITSPEPFTTTNLTAKLSFSRVILADGKLANLTHSVSITPGAK